MNRINTQRKWFRQSGVSLMELLIAMAISLVVTLAMVGLMANTLGTGTQTIQMSRLTAELRASMQIMTRDLRRANFHGNFTECFGDPDCRTTMNGGGTSDVTGYIKAITIGDSVANGDSDCFFLWLDRDADGDVTNDAVGAFRRVVQNSVGIIQMTTTRTTAPTCNSGSDWTALTDSSFVNVTAFTVTNANSFTDTVSASGATQHVDKILINLTV